MALQYDVNNANSLGGPEVLYDLKAVLVLAGWDVKMSSDGVTFGAGDNIGSITEMAVNDAYYVIRAPATMSPRREFLFQKGLTSRSCRCFVSYTAGFTGGGATSRPTATDEQQLIGTAGAYNTVFFLADATYKHHIVADDVTPFGWWMSTNTNGTGVVHCFCVFDPLAAGSYPSADADPAVYYFGQSTQGFDDSNIVSIAGPGRAWYKAGLGGAAFVQMPGKYYYSTSDGELVPNGTGTNPYDGDDNHFPIPYGRSTGAATNIGWKGFGTVMRYLGTNRGDMDTLSTGGTKNKLVQGNVVLPWPDVIPSI